MAEFWDTHDLTDYEEYLTPVEVTISAHPKHHYVVTLSDTLETLLRRVQQKEGVSLNTLVNLWVQEKLQQYATSLSEWSIFPPRRWNAGNKPLADDD